MWIPVLEQRMLGGRPIATSYLGTPIVLFRDERGGVGALEDVCPHRGVPLSTGRVREGRLRCGFHHFAFDRDGQCVSTPKVAKVSEEWRRGCAVRSFAVREAVGLVWVSSVPEEQNPFPIPDTLLPQDAEFITGSFPVQGDPRVWMDHFLDPSHCLWAHAPTAYVGNEERAAEMIDAAIAIGPEDTYPVRDAVRMTYRVRGQPDLRSLLDWAPVAAVGMAGMRMLRRRKPRKPHYDVGIEAGLLTPFCQETRSHMGRDRFISWVSINPGRDGHNDLVWSACFRKAARSGLERWFQHYKMTRFADHHLGVEDSRFLAGARFFDAEELRPTPLDATVLAMRSMYARHRDAWASAFPQDSLIHSLEYGSHIPAEG